MAEKTGIDLIAVIISIIALLLMIVQGFALYIIKDLKASVSTLRSDVGELDKKVNGVVTNYLDRFAEANTDRNKIYKEQTDRENKRHDAVMDAISKITLNCAVIQAGKRE